MGIISSYEKGLPNEILNNSRYAYRVCFVPVNVNKPNQADQAIRFIKPGSEESDAINLAIKETEKPKFLPSTIVEFVRANGFPAFNMDKHTKLWKKFDARNPEKHYGVFVGKQWYWYQNWRDFVLAYLEDTKIQES